MFGVSQGNRSRVGACPPPRNVAAEDFGGTDSLKSATLWGGAEPIRRVDSMPVAVLSFGFVPISPRCTTERLANAPTRACPRGAEDFQANRHDPFIFDPRGPGRDGPFGLSFIRKYCLEFSAAQRRQDVATGVSPWNIVQHTPKAPEGGDRSSSVVDPASESHALEKRTSRFTNVYAMMQVFLSPPSGAFRDGIFRNQGLTPNATYFIATGGGSSSLDFLFFRCAFSNFVDF